jgi:hypothetical protein
MHKILIVYSKSYVKRYIKKLRVYKNVLQRAEWAYPRPSLYLHSLKKQMNPVNNLPFYFRKIHFINILTSTPRSFKRSLPSHFHSKILHYLLFCHICYISRLSHPP